MAELIRKLDSYASFKNLESKSKHTAILLDALESTSTTTKKLDFNTYEVDFQLVLDFAKASIYFETTICNLKNFERNIRKININVKHFDW